MQSGGGRYAFITLQSLCGGRAPGDAALKRAFVPFPRFSKLLFAWLFICIKAEGGGVKISFSCQAQRFPFRVFPLPPPPPDSQHPQPLPTKDTPQAAPPSPISLPITDLEPRGGGCQGEGGIQRPAPQPEGLGDWRGEKVGDKKATLRQGFGGLLAFSRASLSPAGQIWGLCPPQSAPGGSLAGSGAQQREVFLF